MDWQLVIAGAVVSLATIYVARTWYRNWFSASKYGACSGCSCAHDAPKRSNPSID